MAEQRQQEKFRTDPELSERIDAIVQKTRLSRSDVLRDLVRRGMEDWEGEQVYLSRRREPESGSVAAV